jgi:flagellar hook-associated protein 2
MTGLASGIDTKSMVDKLMELERKPIYLKEQEIQKVKFEKKHWEEIGKQVKQFKSVAQDFSKDNVFRKKLSTVSEEGVVEVELGPSAKNGKYTIEDIKLAKAGQATSEFEISLEKEIKTHIESGKLGIRNMNTRFIDMFLSVFGNMEFEDVGFKINGQEIEVEASDSIGTFINKINASGTGVKGSFDPEKNTIRLESEDNSPIEITADDRTFLRGLKLSKYNGKKIKNNIDSESRQSMANVSALNGIKKGLFTINDYTVEVNPDFDSVEDIVRKMNEDSSPIRAFYDENAGKLNLVSKVAGDDLFVQDDTSGFLEKMGIVKNNAPLGRDVTTLFEGQKASFIIDGIKYERNSNDIIFNGMKLNFLSNMENKTITVNVDNDYDAMIKKIEEFVDQYNKTADIINSKTVKDAPLQGNTTANTLASRLRLFMGNSVNGVESKYSQLALIGISTTGKEHNLVINYDKLKAALRENTKEVEKLFTQDDLNLREVLGRGDGKNKKFISLKNAQIDPKDIQVRVGNKVYSKNGKNKLLLKSELERKKLSKVDMIKYVINGDIRSKADLDIHLGKGVPANAAVIDDVTGAIELGKAPDKNEEIIIESSRNINKSKYGFSEGIANKVNNYLNPFVTYGGTFDRQSKAFDSRINQMNDWIARTDERLTMREDALKRQFAGMEGSMSSSNAQSSWLSGQIAQL